MERPQITKEQLLEASKLVEEKLQRILKIKGAGSFASSHEILGVLLEEVNEFSETVYKNQDTDLKIAELKDIAAVAIFSIACLKYRKIDW